MSSKIFLDIVGVITTSKLGILNTFQGTLSKLNPLFSSSSVFLTILKLHSGDENFLRQNWRKTMAKVIWKNLYLYPLWEHNQLLSIVSQLGISIAVISQISQQDVSCIFLPWKLCQIGQPMIVLDYAHQGDSETPPTCLIWSSFG